MKPKQYSVEFSYFVINKILYMVFIRKLIWLLFKFTKYSLDSYLQGNFFMKSPEMEDPLWKITY